MDVRHDHYCFCRNAVTSHLGSKHHKAFAKMPGGRLARDAAALKWAKTTPKRARTFAKQSQYKQDALKNYKEEGITEVENDLFRVRGQLRSCQRR